MDLNGRLVKKLIVVSLATRIDIGNLANGLYILNIKDAMGKNIHTEKIIIQK